MKHNVKSFFFLDRYRNSDGTCHCLTAPVLRKQKRSDQAFSCVAVAVPQTRRSAHVTDGGVPVPPIGHTAQRTQGGKVRV